MLMVLWLDLEGLLRELDTSGLEWLDLGRNRITSEGIKTLTAKFRSSQHLQFLGLAQNPFDGSCLSHVLEIVQQGVWQKWQLSSPDFPLGEIVRLFAEIPDLNYFSGSWIRLRPAGLPTATTTEKTKPPTKFSHWRLWKRRQPPNPELEYESKTSRKIDSDLEKKQGGKPDGMIYGCGNDQLALFRELLNHEFPTEYLRQEGDKMRERVLKWAKDLAVAVPHYGCPMLPGEHLKSLCRTVMDTTSLDTTTGAMIEEFWRQDAVKRALAASQFGSFVFPPQIVPFFDQVREVSKHGYAPVAKDILYWKESERPANEYRFFCYDAPFCFVSGGSKLLDIFEGDFLMIAGSFADMQPLEYIPASKFFAVITYSHPPWTEEQLRMFKGAKKVRATSSMAEICQELKSMTVLKTLVDAGLEPED